MESSRSNMVSRLTGLCAVYLLLLTGFLTLRLMYIVDVSECQRGGVVARQQGEGAGHTGLLPRIGSHGDDGGSGGFRDEYLRPILAAYQREARRTRADTRPPRFRSGRVPKVVMYISETLLAWGWNLWYFNHMKDIHEGRCALPCTVTTNLSQVRTADAVLIYLGSVRSLDTLTAKLGPRDPSQPWIWFETETHMMGYEAIGSDFRKLNGVFNRTMHYRRDSDIKMLHGFVVRRGREASLLPHQWRRPAIVSQDPGVTRKLAVAFISNCHDNSGRLEYVTELRRHAPVDIYGQCGDLKCGKSLYTHDGYRADQEPCLQLAGKTYLFYLAFENSVCTDYVTEKVYNLMYYPMVPVVLGGAEYPLLLPPHSYIDARAYSPPQLAQRLLHLAQHPQEYQQYLAWRQYYLPSTVGGNRVLCDLCVRLHDDDLYQHNVIEDFYDWYVTKGNCSLPAKQSNKV